MYCCTAIGNDIYWVGVNDRKTERFENYLPLPSGVAYNSYLINDEKVCLIDTVEVRQSGTFLNKIEAIIGNKKIDYLVVNHMEPDHSGSMEEILRAFPEITVIGNAKTLQMIKAFYPSFPENSFKAIKEGDILDLGNHKLTFAMVPMVHWPESMVTYDTTEKILFSNDAFGSFGTLDGGMWDDEVNFDFYKGEMRRYYANIVGKYGVQVTNAIKKLGGLEIKYICPSHGILWRKDVNRVIKYYADWAQFIPETKGVVIMYASMYGNTEVMANMIARELSQQGLKEIKVYDVSKTDSSFIMSDIWKYKGLIIGSCAHNNALYPKMQPILEKLQNYGLKNRYVGIFGNMMWSGGGVRGIQHFTDSLGGLEVIGKPVEAKGAPTHENMEDLKHLAREMAKRILEEI